MPRLPAGSIKRLLGRPSLPLLVRRRQQQLQQHQCSCRRRGRRSSSLVRAAYGDPEDGPLKALLQLRGKLRPLGLALRALWEAQRRWLQHTLARSAMWVGLLAGLATVAANVWGVPALNRRLLPLATQQAAAVLHREVRPAASPDCLGCWLRALWTLAVCLIALSNLLQRSVPGGEGATKPLGGRLLQL
jgi:hypothetical protein